MNLFLMIPECRYPSFDAGTIALSLVSKPGFTVSNGTVFSATMQLTNFLGSYRYLIKYLIFRCSFFFRAALQHVNNSGIRESIRNEAGEKTR